MIPAELASLASAVYGERWKSALARDLGLNFTTVHRWAVGHTRIPAAQAIEILAAVSKRLAQAIEAVEGVRD